MAEEVRKVIHIDTQGSQTSVKDLRDNVKKLQDALLGLDSASEEYKQIATQIYSTQQKLNQVMSAGKNAITPYERSLKALTDTYANQRQELRALRTALENLDPASREYQVAFERAAEITHELQERQEMLRNSSSDLGVQLSNMQQIGTGIAAGFSAVNAMMVLTGNHSEDLQKVMVKLQAGIALVQGMKGLEGLTKVVKGYVNGVSKWFDKVVDLISGNKKLATETNLTTKATEENTAAAKNNTATLNTQSVSAGKVGQGMQTAAAGTKAFTTALKGIAKATVVTAIIGALFSLIQKGIGKIMEYLNRGAKYYNDAKTAAGIYYDNEKRSIQDLQTAYDRDIELMKARGATKAELYQRELEYLGEMQNALKKYTDQERRYNELVKEADARSITRGGRGDKKITKPIFGFSEDDMVTIRIMEKKIQEFGSVSLETWNELDTEGRKAFARIRENGIQTFNDLKQAQYLWLKLNKGYVKEWVNETTAATEHEQQVLKNETIKNAKDRNRSEIKVLKDSKAEELAIVGDNSEAKTNIEQYYNKQIWSIITGHTQSIIDNAKAANQTELQNLEDKYKNELATLKRYGRSTVELTAAYEKQKAELTYKKDKEAWENEATQWQSGGSRRMDFEYSLKQQEGMLNALGLPSEKVVKARLDWIHEETVFFLQEQLRWWKTASEDERYTEEDRNEAYQKFISVQNELTKENTDYYVESVNIRIKELERETKKEKEEYDKRLANQKGKYTMSHMPNNFWQNAVGTKNATYGQMKEEMELEYQILVEGLNKQIELRKKTIAEVTGLKGKELEEVIGKDEQISSLQTQIAEATTNKVVEFAEIQKDAWDTILDSTLSVADSFADVLGSIADTMESNIQHQKDAGEITEEEAEKQMEQVRAIQIAQAVINTLSGSIGAFTQASATIPPPAGQIVGAAAAAAVIAAGVAQIAQIKNTKKGSSNITSGLKAAAPALTDYQPEYQANLTGNSEISSLRNALDGTEIRAYVVESDITEAQRRQNRRSSESTF